VRLNFVLFAIGAWLLQRQAALPATATGWLVVCGLALIAVVCLVLTRARPGVRVSVAAAWLAAGFMWASTLAHVRLADSLAAEWEGRDITVIGVVATLPQTLERGVRFEFDVDETVTPGARVPRHIALSWWTSAAREQVQVRAGERWAFTVRLKRPHGMINPHGYDYEAWLLEHDIRATGYVRGSRAQRVAAMVHRPAYWVEAVRGMLRDRILTALDGRPYAGVLAALAVGDQRAVPADQWQIFTRTGVNHLMSISGLHITMVSGLAFALCSWAWRRSARLTLALPARKAAVIVGVCAALVYTLLAGFAVPAQRTLYMLVVVAAALWAGVYTSATRVLAVALFIVVLLDPWAVLSPGYWLSFGAVAVIMHATMHRIAVPHWFTAWARTQWAVTVGLVPLLLALFQQVSLVSPFANAVAIPVVSLIVVPLVLAGMLLPFDVLLHIAHAVMAVCMGLLDWMSALPAPVWQQHAPPAWTVIAASMGALWLLLPRGFPARGLGAVAMLPLVLVAPPAPPAGAAWITVLDVGHGLAVAIQTRSHALLYDSGPAYGPGADAGNRIVLPFLRASGISRLDGVILTHDDADHTGGALSVLEAMPVGWMMSTLEDADPLLFHVETNFRCRAGLEWQWDGVRFSVLHPARDGDTLRHVKDNDRSCVLKIATDAASVLLPADIELKSEMLLVAQGVEALKADVLVAPHQGSRTSSSPAFIDAVSPRATVFPAGYRNRFGHPHEDVVARYRGMGTALYRTDYDGAIRIELPVAGGVQLQRHRDVYRRYWHDAPAIGRVQLDDESPAFIQ
jgi:competence protein ComEC